MNNQIRNWLEHAVYGIYNAVEQQLYELHQNSAEITESTIESLIDSNIELAMQNGEWHITQAIKGLVKESIDTKHLLNEYGTEEENDGS